MDLEDRDTRHIGRERKTGEREEAVSWASRWGRREAARRPIQQGSAEARSV